VRLFQFLKSTVKTDIAPLDSNKSQECAQIHQKSFIKGWSDADIDNLARERNVIANELKDHKSGKIYGFVLSRRAADEAEILSIAIDPKYRGRGWAAQLLKQHMKELAQLGVHKLFLEVDEMNIAACKLYDKCGFYKVGERQAYYETQSGQRSLAYILRKDIEI
jgi:[ribosomal protein S18]-alanine N-acetyltransferase